MLIGKVQYRLGGDYTGLYKDDVLFGKVADGKIYFLNTSRDFVNVKHEQLDNDQFLKLAKQAYSVASEIQT